VYEITLNNNGNRTNNFCEGWNSYFNKLVGTKNLSFWLGVKCIQQDEATTWIERTLSESIINNTLMSKSSKKNKINSLQDKLHNECESYLAILIKRLIQDNF